MDLPSFRYHPDPLATGSVKASRVTCECCFKARGFIYCGPVYADEELDESICPWCIASGEANRRFDAEFVDSAGVGGVRGWPVVDDEVIEEVALRTPGFSGWQQERWWTHCDDAAEYLGRAGAADVAKHGSVTVEHLRDDLGWDEGQQFDDYVKSLDAKGQPTAYLFRCRHCGEVGGYSDFT